MGSYNVVWFIDFEDDVHWVFRTPQMEWSPSLERRMRSDIVTIKLIQSRTTIPIPVIHDFSVDTNNTIGRPYMVLDRVEGTQLWELWYDRTWFTEERRKNVFRSLISYLTQLRVFEFPSIGCIEHDPKTDTLTVGPLLRGRDDILRGLTSLRGPYYSSHAYLCDEISIGVSEADNKYFRTWFLLLRLFAGALPDHSLDGPPFVLGMPDFSPQNIFVDSEGHVTGLVDWDDINTFPRQGGYARYPPWITRDWDPVRYGYFVHNEVSKAKDDEERRDGEGSGDLSDHATSGRSKDNHSCMDDAALSNGVAIQLDHIPTREEKERRPSDPPHVLQKFRDEYLRTVEEVDPVAATSTRHSHIYDAITTGVYLDIGRIEIIERLMEYVFEQSKVSASNLFDGVLEGQWAAEHD
ncbi:hypothetical protein C0992_006059 [Termitomyces sp. T32_za158]|nr:hypothetical protein C0992_006059 [Termitomyces sp. T32_za158]